MFYHCLRRVKVLKCVMINKQKKLWSLIRACKQLWQRVSRYFIILIISNYIIQLYNFFKGLQWKQLLFYDFDTSMTNDILFNIISKMHDVGFEIVTIVSDMRLTNIGLWKALGITLFSSRFNNPVTNKSIYVFADILHLIKLAINHFIDKGFVIPGDIYTGKRIIEQYLNVSKSFDYKLARKLSEQHSNVTGSLRKNVKLAAQLFSYSVAKALKYCGENKIIDDFNCEKVF